MTCSHCSKEYDSSLQSCPECGRALTYGTPSAPPPPFVAEPYGFDLSTTVSVSGSSSIRSRLRPRTVWEIIGEAFSIYWQNWKVFLPAAMILYIPMFIAQFLYQRAVYDIPTPNGPPSHIFMWGERIVPYFVMLAGVSIAMSMVMSFALTRGVSNCYLNKTVSVGEMLKLNGRFWGFLGANFLVGMLYFAMLLVAVVPLVLAIAGAVTHHSHDAGALALLMVAMPVMLLMFLALFISSVWFMVVSPVAVVEGRGAAGSVRRGVSLLRGFYWKGAGVILLAGLITGMVSAAIGALGSAFTIPYIMSHSTGPGAGNPMAGMPLWALGGQLVFQWIGSSLAVPISLLILVLFYYDLRIRKEAFDLQMLAEQLGYGMKNPAAD